MKLSMLDRLIISFSLLTDGYIKLQRMIEFIHLAYLETIEHDEILFTKEELCKCCNDGPCSKEIKKSIDKLSKAKKIKINGGFIKVVDPIFSINSLGLSDEIICRLYKITNQWSSTYNVGDIKNHVAKVASVICKKLNSPVPMPSFFNYFLRLLAEK